MKITVLEPLAVKEEELLKMAENILKAGHELEIFPTIAATDEENIERVKDTDILVIANSPLNRRVIESAGRLKYIAVAFTGVDHVDLEACRDRGIKVSNAAGYSTNSVSELAFGLMIDLYRNVIPLDKKTRLGETKAGFRQRDIAGKTLGIIGLGEIGEHTAYLGKAFGCKVLGYNRSRKKELESFVDYVDLDTLLEKSDIVTIHLPLNQETKGLIAKKQLEKMKEDAIIINTARGPIIDLEDLADALDTGIIAGAGIDVYNTEPPLDVSKRILKAKNCIVLPHIGFFTEEAMVRRWSITLDNIDSYLEGSQKNIII